MEFYQKKLENLPKNHSQNTLNQRQKPIQYKAITHFLAKLPCFLNICSSVALPIQPVALVIINIMC